MPILCTMEAEPDMISFPCSKFDAISISDLSDLMIFNGSDIKAQMLEYPVLLRA